MANRKEREYYNLKMNNEVRNTAKKLRRKFLRYKDAEIVYSMSHKMILELASRAGAIYRYESTVLIDRDIFDEYLEQFHEPPVRRKSRLDKLEIPEEDDEEYPDDPGLPDEKTDAGYVRFQKKLSQIHANTEKKDG